MTKTIIYSCVFFNEKYINLVNLLLQSYKIFGNSPDDVDYLIICNTHFQKKIEAIFYNLNISGKIWCIDLKTKFAAGYSRLNIFAYPEINLYKKILYLDCDILITNSINNILDFKLSNKLYTLQEGNTNHQFYGGQFFDKNPNCSAFTSGILLFNNNIIIKDLFSQILLHIHNHINSDLPIPVCLDQPFIVYHAVKNNLYNNQKLIGIVINNPNNFKNETISHFPGGPGNYESKIVKMTNYMRNIMFHTK
jgi:lipopolysaccharide biosynthesis glycosyltransferase